MDAMKFRWDRYVVRFSDAEQQRGVEWAFQNAARAWAKRPSAKAALFMLGAAALLYAAYAVWKHRRALDLLFSPRVPTGTAVALRPLLKAARIQPLPGETLRAWLVRLGERRPDRRASLMALAGLVEGRIYGQSQADIARPAKAEAREWRRNRGYSGPTTATQ